MSLAAESFRKKMKSAEAIFEGEAVILQGPANHFLRGEGRGGWLTLTPTRLAFRSHGVNLQNRPVDIDIDDVAEAVAVLTVGIVPNGLRIRRKDGQRESFVVSRRKEWVRCVQRQIRIGQAGSRAIARATFEHRFKASPCAPPCAADRPAPRRGRHRTTLAG
jgi:hypothetical protein